YFTFLKQKGLKKPKRGKIDEVSDDDFDEFLEKHEKGLNVGSMGMFDSEEDLEMSQDEEEDSGQEVDSDEFEQMDGIDYDSDDADMDLDEDEEEDVYASDFDDDSDDEMGGKASLDKLFVAAESIGAMYDDNQQMNKKGSSAGKKRNWPKSRGNRKTRK
ncbi:hypothetical protein Ciccas_010118, partial [Cichlidogyrus casuarinus]